MVGEWSWGGWWLRCLMWSGSVGIHKPSSELNSFTCMFPRFIVCYIKSLNKLLYQMFWWAAVNDWPAYIPLSQVICIKFKGRREENAAVCKQSRSMRSCPFCTKSAQLQTLVPYFYRWFLPCEVKFDWVTHCSEPTFTYLANTWHCV